MNYQYKINEDIKELEEAKKELNRYMVKVLVWTVMRSVLLISFHICIIVLSFLIVEDYFSYTIIENTFLSKKVEFYHSMSIIGILIFLFSFIYIELYLLIRCKMKVEYEKKEITKFVSHLEYISTLPDISDQLYKALKFDKSRLIN